MSNTLSTLDRDAHLRIVPVEGGLAGERATPLLAVLREMISQWKQNGVIKTGAVELLEGGAFIAVAYEPTGQDLSGCTKDQLTHTLLQFEEQLGLRLINAPNLAVELNGEVRLLDREEFRRLRAEGTITESVVAFDHLLQRAGDLPQFRTTVGKSWYNRIGRPKTNGETG